MFWLTRNSVFDSGRRSVLTNILMTNDEIEVNEA